MNVALALLLVASATPEPLLVRVPDQGVQPQAVMEASGTLHLVYLKGPEGASDVYYVRRGFGSAEFSRPLRVNSQPGSAIAVGTIRGAQLALGKSNRVHVAWNGSSEALPKSAKNSMPMLYARLGDAGTAFEPQRNLMQKSFVLDGGGTVAADPAGNVYVAWHGLPVGSPPGEINRKVWVARSSDEGKTFAPETPATDEPTGACGCCGMRGFVDSTGMVHFLYRSAKEQVNRDIYLISSRDRDVHCQLVHPWKVAGCPMSSEAFAEGQGKVVLAWESNNRVFFAEMLPGTAKFSAPIEAPGKGTCRHPAVAVNKNGEILLAWSEGTAWKKGGTLAWQKYDAAGKPVGETGRVAGGIPVWGNAAVAAQPDGRFVIIH